MLSLSIDCISVIVFLGDHTSCPTHWADSAMNHAPRGLYVPEPVRTISTCKKAITLPPPPYPFETRSNHTHLLTAFSFNLSAQLANDDIDNTHMYIDICVCVRACCVRVTNIFFVCAHKSVPVKTHYVIDHCASPSPPPPFSCIILGIFVSFFFFLFFVLLAPFNIPVRYPSCRQEINKKPNA